jgi:hypothetical protein
MCFLLTFNFTALVAILTDKQTWSLTLDIDGLLMHHHHKDMDKIFTFRQFYQKISTAIYKVLAYVMKTLMKLSEYTIIYI